MDEHLWPLCNLNYYYLKNVDITFILDDGGSKHFANTDFRPVFRKKLNLSHSGFFISRWEKQCMGTILCMKLCIMSARSDHNSRGCELCSFGFDLGSRFLAVHSLKCARDKSLHLLFSFCSIRRIYIQRSRRKKMKLFLVSLTKQRVPQLGLHKHTHTRMHTSTVFYMYYPWVHSSYTQTHFLPPDDRATPKMWASRNRSRDPASGSMQEFLRKQTAEEFTDATTK